MSNAGRVLVKKKVLKEIETINNVDVYGTYNDLYLSAKEREEQLLQQPRLQSIFSL